MMLEAWRTFYNGSSPHSVLGNRTPSEFARQAGANPGLSGASDAGKPTESPVEKTGCRQYCRKTSLQTGGENREDVKDVIVSKCLRRYRLRDTDQRTSLTAKAQTGTCRYLRSQATPLWLSPNPLINMRLVCFN